MTSQHTVAPSRAMLNKVPEVTIYFWIIKVLCTTVGETAADFLNIDLGFGLTGTSIATGVVLVVVMAFQFRAHRYVPGLYWAAVTLVSVFGTLVTDNLTDNLTMPLQASTAIFGVALAVVFILWYRGEGTLSIHAITTRTRESYYWVAILVTFALGTATGDLMAEALSLGYVISLLVVAALIAIITLAWRVGLHPVLAFWIIYILTRPLGASLGDLLSQAPEQGGLGLGPTITSVVFLAAILLIVVYLSLTRADVIDHPRDDDRTVAIATDGHRAGPRNGLIQTVVVVALLLAVAVVGFTARTAQLQSAGADAAATAGSGEPTSAGAPAKAAGPNAAVGDVSRFRTIAQDTLSKLDAGDQSGATTRVTDLETAWDQNAGRLEARDKAAWTRVDTKIDDVLTELRAGTPDPTTEKAALNALLAELG